MFCKCGFSNNFPNDFPIIFRLFRCYVCIVSLVVGSFTPPVFFKFLARIKKLPKRLVFKNWIRFINIVIHKIFSKFIEL